MYTSRCEWQSPMCHAVLSDWLCEPWLPDVILWQHGEDGSDTAWRETRRQRVSRSTPTAGDACATAALATTANATARLPTALWGEACKRYLQGRKVCICYLHRNSPPEPLAIFTQESCISTLLLVVQITWSAALPIELWQLATELASGANFIWLYRLAGKL